MNEVMQFVDPPTRIAFENKIIREKTVKKLLFIAAHLRESVYLHSSMLTMDKDDVYSVASEAIVVAVDTYDKTKGCTLQSYATSKAKWAVSEAIRNSRHSSRSMQDKGRNVRWCYFSAPVPSAGFDAEFTYEDWASNLADKETESVFMQVAGKHERQKLFELLYKLEDRSRKVLLWRMQNKTNREIGDMLGVSESRAYQLGKLATEKMQHQIRSEYE